MSEVIRFWPNIKPGTIFHGNVVNYDFLPTFVDWAGGNPEDLKEIDDVSLGKSTDRLIPNSLS